MGLICHDEDRDANRNAESSGPDRPASIIVGRTSEFSFPPGRLAREEEQFLRWADRRARIPDTDRGDTPLNERQRSEGRGESCCPHTKEAPEEFPTLTLRATGSRVAKPQEIWVARPGTSEASEGRGQFCDARAKE